MELRHYFGIIRHRLWLLVLCVIVGSAGAYVAAPRTSTYAAQSTLYVGVRQFTSYDPGLSSNVAVAGIERVITTFARMVGSREIATAAIAKANVPRSPDGVLAATQVTPEQNTQLIRILVRDPDPAAAQALANGLAEAFVERIESFEPGAAPREGDVPQLPANLFERATLPTVPQAVDVTRRVILGALFGLVFAVGLALLLDYLDVTIKNQADAERLLELPVLGVVPYRRQPAVAQIPERRDVPV